MNVWVSVCIFCVLICNIYITTQPLISFNQSSRSRAYINAWTWIKMRLWTLRSKLLMGYIHPDFYTSTGLYKIIIFICNLVSINSITATGGDKIYVFQTAWLINLACININWLSFSATNIDNSHFYILHHAPRWNTSHLLWSSPHRLAMRVLINKYSPKPLLDTRPGLLLSSEHNIHIGWSLRSHDRWTGWVTSWKNRVRFQVT